MAVQGISPSPQTRPTSLDRRARRRLRCLWTQGTPHQLPRRQRLFRAAENQTHVLRGRARLHRGYREKDKMNIMRPLSAVFVVVSLSLAAVRAQDKGAAPPREAPRLTRRLRKSTPTPFGHGPRNIARRARRRRRTARTSRFTSTSRCRTPNSRRVSWRSRNGTPRDQMRSKPSTSRSGPAMPPGSAPA